MFRKQHMPLRVENAVQTEAGGLHEKMRSHPLINSDRDRRPGLSLFLLIGMASAILVAPAETAGAETGYELVRFAVDRAESGDMRNSILILESFYPGIGKSPDYLSWLALGLALTGRSSHAVDVIDKAITDDLPSEVLNRLIRAACRMEQYSLARACANRIKDPQRAAEKTEALASIQADYDSKNATPSFTEAVAMLRVSGTFESSSAREPEPVEFPGYPGVLKGHLIRPLAPEGTRSPAIIYFPGGTFMDQPPPPRNITSDELATALGYVQKGYHFLFVSPRGSTASGGVYWSDRKSAGDMSAAAAYLASRVDVDGARIFAFGRDSGGAVALWSLALPSASIRAAVAFGPRTDPSPEATGEGLSAYEGFTPSFLKSRSLAANVEDLNKPGLVVVGRETPEMLIDEARRFEARAMQTGRPIEFAFLNETDYTGDIMRGPGHDVVMEFLDQFASR